MVNAKTTDSEHFVRTIHHWVGVERLEWLEAIMRYVEEYGVEVEYVANLVRRNQPVLQQLEAELVQRRVLKNESTALSLTSFMIDPN